MPTLPDGAAGGTQYRWTEDYSEDSGPGGTVITAVLMTEWSQHLLSNFPVSMLGRHTRAGGGISRSTPLVHPLKDWLHCTHCKLVRGIGYVGEETGNEMIKFDQAQEGGPGKMLWEVQFSHLGYDVEEDEFIQGLQGKGKELARFVSRKSQGSVEALPVEGTSWKYKDAPPGTGIIPEPTTVLFANVELEYTWYWVPHPLPTALDILLNHVNDKPFDGRNGHPSYNEGTVCYVGYEKSDALPDAQGNICSHVTLRFLVKRHGWNRFWRPYQLEIDGVRVGSPGFADVVAADGSGVTPFPEHDLMELFGD